MTPEDKAYLALLSSRLNHFKGQPIEKLTDTEIREYLNIRSEIGELLTPLAENIANAVQPAIAAIKRYSANVIEKE